MTDFPQPIETAPKDRRILIFVPEPVNVNPTYSREKYPDWYGWMTAKWDDFRKEWCCEPNEATEYNCEPREPSHWADLPSEPSA